MLQVFVHARRRSYAIIRSLFKRISVSHIVLLIQGDAAMTPGRFLLMNIAMVVGTCSLYFAYLVFLIRKRARAGVYDLSAPDER